MNVAVIVILAVGCAVLLVLESRGMRTTLRLEMKGDIKRESAMLAQWGQSVSTPIACLLMWQLNHAMGRYAIVTLVAVIVTSFVCFFIKHLCSRVRPNRENAGKFLGPSFRHNNAFESFVSSHSACAVALSFMLAHAYPPAASTFWALAIITAVLRYVLDAHWPSDVLGGSLVGYVMAGLTIQLAGV